MRSTHATMREMNQPPATYDDIKAAPEGVRAELIDGELFLQAHPAFDHQSVLFRLCGSLDRRFAAPTADASEPPTGWVLAPGPELWLGGVVPQSLVLVPDVAGWRRGRFARSPDSHGVVVAPDWVCEILSPSTQRYDRLNKAAAYAGAGVDWYWLIDPIARFVEVFERQDGAYVRVAAVAAEERAALQPFGGEPVALATWWADLG